jgi:hypothetical protein
MAGNKMGQVSATIMISCRRLSVLVQTPSLSTRGRQQTVTSETTPSLIRLSLNFFLQSLTMHF